MGQTITAPGANRVHGSCHLAEHDGVAYPALLDPKWTTTGSMSKERNAHTATVLPTGKVLVAGGTDGIVRVFERRALRPALRARGQSTGEHERARASTTPPSCSTRRPTRRRAAKCSSRAGRNGSALNSAQLYSPSAGTWTAPRSMNASRYQHEATLLANGRVLVTGGVSGSYVLNTAAVYNPSSGTGSWSAVSSMAVSRRWHTRDPTFDHQRDAQQQSARGRRQFRLELASPACSSSTAPRRGRRSPRFRAHAKSTPRRCSPTASCSSPAVRAAEPR